MTRECKQYHALARRLKMPYVLTTVPYSLQRTSRSPASSSRPRSEPAITRRRHRPGAHAAGAAGALPPVIRGPWSVEPPTHLLPPRPCPECPGWQPAAAAAAAWGAKCTTAARGRCSAARGQAGAGGAVRSSQGQCRALQHTHRWVSSGGSWGVGNCMREWSRPETRSAAFRQSRRRPAAAPLEEQR